MNDMNTFLTPGMIVRHPGQPSWGEGQVQSNISGRVTVNFVESGKQVIDSGAIALILVST
ncbi:MAG: DUF3553 domain-containing protein [Rhodobacteraceae bacterium]|nr:DUF3553 domain-containing protein [Paracoccaceae bacterium]